MNIYIWEYVEGLTENYHDGGGLLIVDESLEAAREQFKIAYPDQQCECLTSGPDHIWPTEADSICIRFRDAGCC